MFDSSNTLSVPCAPGNIARLRHSSRGGQTLWLVCRPLSFQAG